MKVTKLSPFRRILVISSGSLVVFCLIAWSPPSGENVQVNSGHVLVRDGVFENKPTSGTDNTYGTAPSLILGTNNDSKRGGSGIELGKGVLAGTSNLFSTGGSYSILVGAGNNVWAASSIVAGNNNLVSSSATSFQESTKYSMISGVGNVIGKDCETLLLGGRTNTVQAYSSLVAGNTNTVEGATVGSTAFHSAAIGHLNSIMATYGWTMGYSNTVSGSRGVAIGSGLTASNIQSTALGRFNSTMSSNDILVIGAGTAATTPNTAFRVTSDGGVVLGSPTSGKVVLAKAQGDISMGAYTN